jgi:hypothetical protein
MEELSKMIQYAEEFGKPSMEKLNQMDIKEIFNFMDNFLLDQDFSEHVAKKTFLQNAFTSYEVKYTANKEIESIRLIKSDYDVMSIELNVMGIFCYFTPEHHSRKIITKMSWKYLKDIMFKD